MTGHEHILSEEILRPIGEAKGMRSKPEFCGFLACRGKLYDGGLMVVGRAVNKWRGCISFEDIASAENRQRFVKDVADSAQGGDCPMQWVLACWGRPRGATRRKDPPKGYNTKRSAFWRVINQVTRKVCTGVREENWPSHLVWSNLYKVAPSKGYNPTVRQMNAQREGCKKLLRLEIEDFAPSRLLFLTGWDWAQPFLQEWGDVVPAEDTYVEATGRLRTGKGRSCAMVVARHPDRKPGAPWVKEVLAAFDQLGAS